MTEKTYLLEDHCSWLTMQRKVTQVIVRDIYLVKKVQFCSLPLWALKLKVNISRGIWWVCWLSLMYKVKNL